MRMIAVSDGEWLTVASFDGYRVMLLERQVIDPGTQLAVLLMLLRAGEEWERASVGGMN